MRYLRSIFLVACLLPSSAALADCRNTLDFNQWLNQFKREAATAGLSPQVMDKALQGLTPDPEVIRRDRSQHVFAQTFLEFSAKKVSRHRLTHGRNHLKRNAALFRRIEQQFGVPGEVLAAFWGLESDFGVVTGNYPTLRSVLTLAYDCRRPELFRPELMGALWLIQKGDLTAANMRGAWAGELGQLQFLPSRYNQYAVDYDRDGHRDLIRSSADALASAARLLKKYGWRAGEPWLQEVRVPTEMDWSLARLNNKLALAEWKKQGVTLVNGQPLPNAGRAALLLPMGRNGPAFLAYPNFDVFLKWNESTVYSTTAAYLATRFAGAPALRAGNAPVAKLSIGQVKQLQSKLKARGLPVGKIDGIIGEMTRDAVRRIQQQLGLPADGYPDPELLRRLR
ncbi:MAG: lytic transglycosylase [Proteobacteria bacterium]|nr:MAG: lytic transglycosylase [Pseudomonadota bacterium]